jgi:hypothetical protein
MKTEKEERKESIMIENADAYNRYYYLFNQKRIDNNHSRETDIERDQRFS